MQQGDLAGRLLCTELSSRIWLQVSITHMHSPKHLHLHESNTHVHSLWTCCRSCPSQELFITSKLWNSNHAPHNVVKALKRSLANLKLDYLDLYLIHWPATGNKGSTVQPSLEVRRALQLSSSVCAERWLRAVLARI